MSSSGPTDGGGPVYVLNVLWFKPGGAERYQEYLAASRPLVERLGGAFLEPFTVTEALEGGLDADMVFYGRYPSRDALMGMLSSPEYQAVFPLREAAVERSITSLCAPLPDEPPDPPRSGHTTRRRHHWSMAIRRVVTGFDPNGDGAVLFDGPAPAEMALPPEVGATLVDLWRSDTLPLGTTDRSDATEAEFALMPPGCLFRVIDLQPGTTAPMWHTTASVDFNYVASGRATVLIGEEGTAPIEVDLDAGDTFVHRGPRHAWVNRGDDVCRLVCTSIAASLPPGVEPG